MKKLSLALSLSTLALSACAYGEAAELYAMKTSDEYECRRVKEMGTLIGDTQCMKPEQWASYDKQQEEAARHTMDRADRGLGRSGGAQGTMGN